MTIHDEQAKAWAKNLAQALNVWLKKNGYGPGQPQSFQAFADRAEITERQLRTVKGAENLTQPEVYARIWLMTGIRAADPTTIPPRVVMLPQGGTKVTKRAWTDQEFREWIAKQQNTKPAPQPAPAHQKQAAPAPVTDQLGQVLTLAMHNAVRQALVDAGLHDLVPHLQRLEELLSSQTSTPHSQNLQEQIRSVANELSNLLGQVVDSNDPNLLDELYQEHGEVLADLWTLLGALTLDDPEDRAAQVRATREYNND